MELTIKNRKNAVAKRNETIKKRKQEYLRKLQEIEKMEIQQDK